MAPLQRRSAPPTQDSKLKAQSSKLIHNPPGSELIVDTGGMENGRATETGRQVNGTSGAGLGTFAGVFTPSILTILGIILFLRTGYVVGNAGFGGALLIIAIATSVSVLTSISLAAIATNIQVKGGGDYYLISRTLGLEFGGAIGVVLFLAQSISVAFYAIGFGEALTAMIGWDSRLGVQLIAAVAVLALFAFAWAGADVATRLQFVIMALLIVALVSFFAGAIGAFDTATFGDSWSAPPGAIGYWAAFAIFFPAVTGFTQGVSMSGDLKDPSRSLPVGTFSAVGLSTIVYVAVAILIAGGVPLTMLVSDDGSAMRDLAADRCTRRYRGDRGDAVIRDGIIPGCAQDPPIDGVGPRSSPSSTDSPRVMAMPTTPDAPSSSAWP